MFGYDLGIDLGTSSIVISVVGKGVVLSEPAYVAYDVNKSEMLMPVSVLITLKAENLSA